MISLTGVTKKYENGTLALDNVSINIPEGEFVFIVGSSGAGKSTMMRLCLMEEKASEGKVLVNGYDLTSLKPKEVPYFRRTLGVVFQDFRLIPTMSVYDNVAFALRVTNIHPKDIKRRVPYILNLMGLQGKAKNFPDELSGGEQQRVALARALVNNPKVIIADEPTGNIDPELSFEIVELLTEINKYGTTVVMVTHNHELVAQFRHRIVQIEKGRIVADGRIGGRYAK